MPEPRQHALQRGTFETVLRYIPGFRGYLEKEYRRESDALLREWFADRLGRAKRSLDDYARGLVDAGQLAALPQCDRLRLRVDKLISRIRGAMQGYSGIFDLVRVNEQTLDRVYDYDAALVERVGELADRLEKLPSEQAEPAAVVAELLAKVEELEQSWDDREDILKGVD